MDHQKSNKNLTVAGLLLGIFIASMDNTVVSTALGTIVADLGGMEKLIWASSAYMIACVAGMPIYGKLSDMYGRKRFFVFGLSLFILGSILCGTAHSMVQLSVYRAVQGLGGGAVMPIAFTIIFDIYPPRERGKMSGLFGAVFGLSSVCGPLLGAFLTDYASWHWIFFVNIPLGLLAVFLISKFYCESLDHHKQQIDWWGAILIVVAVISLMFALQLGGKEYSWGSWQIMGLFIISGLAFISFLQAEKRAHDPIIPLDLFSNRLFAASQLAALFTGAVFIIFTVYAPVFIQGVSGGTATNAGLILMPMMIASVAGSQLGGRYATFRPYRDPMLLSGLLLLAGTFLMSTISVHTGRGLITLYLVIIGFGVGISFPVLQMASTHEMPFHRRATTTSAVTFFRTIGMTLSVSVFGAVQKNMMLGGIKHLAMNIPVDMVKDLRVLLQPQVRQQIPAAVLEPMTDVLAHSIVLVFRWSILTAVIALIAIYLMGNAQLQRVAENEDQIGKAEMQCQ